MAENRSQFLFRVRKGAGDKVAFSSGPVEQPMNDIQQSMQIFVHKKPATVDAQVSFITILT
jgi:hypothetical protein